MWQVHTFHPFNFCLSDTNHKVIGFPPTPDVAQYEFQLKCNIVSWTPLSTEPEILMRFFKESMRIRKRFLKFLSFVGSYPKDHWINAIADWDILVFLQPFFQILTLHFVVLSFDRYSRDDVMGEVMVFYWSSFLIGDFIIGQVMVEMEGLDLSNSETCPLSLVREITPRYTRVSRK